MNLRPGVLWSLVSLDVVYMTRRAILFMDTTTRCSYCLSVVYAGILHATEVQSCRVLPDQAPCWVSPSSSLASLYPFTVKSPAFFEECPGRQLFGTRLLLGGYGATS